jgi:hypothetical protein
MTCGVRILFSTPTNFGAEPLFSSAKSALLSGWLSREWSLLNKLLFATATFPSPGGL